MFSKAADGIRKVVPVIIVRNDWSGQREVAIVYDAMGTEYEGTMCSSSPILSTAQIIAKTATACTAWSGLPIFFLGR